MNAFLWLCIWHIKLNSRLIAKSPFLFNSLVYHYIFLNYDNIKIWNTEITKVHIVPIIIGALGIVTDNAASYL